MRRPSLLRRIACGADADCGGRRLVRVLSNLTEAQLTEIKARSETRLRALGVKVNENLPLLDVSALRPASQIAARAVVMNALSEAGEGAPAALVRKWIEKNRLEGALTPEENKVLAAETPLQAIDRDGMLWRAEGAWALTWVLGRIETLELSGFAPKERKELWPDLKKNEAALPYLGNLSTRAVAEVAAHADTLFRLHWAIVDATYLAEPFPFETFHPDLILERRRALQWALSPQLAWDQVDLSV